MRGRPLAAVFLCMIVILAAMHALGLPFPGERRWDAETLRMITGSGEACISGSVTAENVYDDGISYLISGTVLEMNGRHLQIGSVMLYFKYSPEELPIDAYVKAYGKLVKYEHAANEGGFDAYEYYAGDDRYFKMTADRTEVLSVPDFSFRRILGDLREQMKETLLTGAGEENGSVLAAMVLGDRSSVSDETERNFSSAGLSHLMAISGLHLTLIGMWLLELLKRLSMKKYAACAVSLSFLLAYTVFTGAKEATVRAFIMFAVMAIGKCLLRSYDSVSALSAAGIIVLILKPSSLFRAGFQFSFAAAFGAAVIGPLLVKRLRVGLYERGRIRGVLLSAALIWLSVQIATVPVMLWHFYEFPVLSILPNMIFVPMMSLLMLLGFAGVLTGMLFPAAARILLFVPSVLTQAMEKTGALLQRVPFCSVVTGRPALFQIGAYVLGVIMLISVLSGAGKPVFSEAATPVLSGAGKPVLSGAVKLPASSKQAVCTALASFTIFVSAFFFIHSGFRISMLDIGQGDCIVIRNDTHVFIMDSGSTSKEEIAQNILIPFLKFHGITKVDAVFVSHADLDHISGITEMLEGIKDFEYRISVGRLVLPVIMEKDAQNGDENAEGLISLGAICTEGISYVTAGDSIRQGELVFRILAPGERVFEDRNENSLVMTASWQGFRILFTGDIGEDAESAAARDGLLTRCDVLKVAHHGSSGSTSEEFLSAVRPSAALISCGRNNRYGHPHAETIEALKESGADVYCTAESGEIIAEVQKDGRYTIRTMLH